MPVFSTFIGPDADPIDKHHDLWNGLLPHDRTSAGYIAQDKAESGLTYGDYFSAAHAFLAQSNYRNLRKALARMLDRNVPINAIQSVHLHLIKHGRFYHPACVTTEMDGQQSTLVLNVAISAEGRKIIGEEYENLRRLNEEFPISFLPEVYVFGEVTGPGGVPIKLFLGEWLHDYHEFHLSQNPISTVTQDRPRVVIWNKSRDILDKRQTSDLIRNACMILTFYYNPETFEQIFPWHHAAGDFVVKLEEDQVSLKLITVRGYSPLFTEKSLSHSKQNNTETILEALLLFFVQLSLRIRIDRADGVDNIVFYAEDCIPAITDGFFQGLNLLAAMRGYPDDFCTAVKAYLCALTPNELAEFVNTYVSRYMSMPDDEEMTDKDISQHIQSLISALNA